MLVYRIEHYRCKEAIGWTGEYYHYAGPFGRYSWPMDENARQRMYSPNGPRENWWDEYRGRSEVFACPSIEALINWFDHEIMLELAKCGYRISVYEVSNDNVQVCPYGEQCSFRADHAKRIGKRIKYNGEESISCLRRAKAA